MWLTLVALLAAQVQDLTMPGWLAGGWSAEAADGAWVEEWWTPPRAGLMIGAGRSGKAGKLDWWEHTRIELAGGKLRFCALPKGQAGACFEATEVSGSEIVFRTRATISRLVWRTGAKATSYSRKSAARPAPTSSAGAFGGSARRPSRRFRPAPSGRAR